MSADVTNEMECCRKFLEHRAALPAGALTPYAGRWIAWGPDGARIVAVSQAPEDLDDRIRAAGEDPERCVVEGVPTTDAMLGGEGLGAAGSLGCDRRLRGSTDALGHPRTCRRFAILRSPAPGLAPRGFAIPECVLLGVPCDSSVVSSVKLRGGRLCCAHLHGRKLLR